MDKITLKQLRGQRVVDLLTGSKEIKTLGQLSKRLTNNLKEAKRLEAKLRRHVPDEHGIIAVKNPLHYSLCKRIADVFGEQPSSVYFERLPQEQETDGELTEPKQPNKKQTRKIVVSTETPINFAPTVSVPRLGIKDQPVETKLVHTKKGYALQFRLTVTSDKIRKLLEGKL